MTTRTTSPIASVQRESAESIFPIYYCELTELASSSSVLAENQATVVLQKSLLNIIWQKLIYAKDTSLMMRKILMQPLHQLKVQEQVLL